MARKLTIDINQIAPSGYIELKWPVNIDSKQYKRIWAEFWDVSRHKDRMDLQPPESENPKHWVWHGVSGNEIKFHIEGDKIVNFVATDYPPKDDDIYIFKEQKKGKCKKK